jgi:hypothetical protein
MIAGVGDQRCWVGGQLHWSQNMWRTVMNSEHWLVKFKVIFMQEFEINLFQFSNPMFTDQRQFSFKNILKCFAPEAFVVILKLILRVITQCCNESSHWLGLESLFSATRLEYKTKNDSTRVNSPKWLDSDSTCWFCRKWLEWTQLQLVQNKFIKIIVIVLLGKNNENFETLSENIWDLHRIQYIPDGHAYITFLFFETTLVPQFLRWSLKSFYTYTNLVLTGYFHFLVFMKCYTISN